MSEGKSPTVRGGPERQEALAKAHALRAEGYTYDAIADRTGVPSSTVSDWCQRLESAAAGDEELSAAERRVLSRSFGISTEAADELLQRLADPEQRKAFSNKDLVVAYGTATDKIAAQLQWHKPKPQSTDNDRSLVEQLIHAFGPDGGTVTLDVEPRHQPIDVTPEKSE